MRDDGRLHEARMIPIGRVAEQLGLRLARITATEKAGPCPNCGGHEKADSDRLNINTAKGVFFCRKCPVSGDVVELVKVALGCDFLAALSYLVGEAEAKIDPELVEKRRRDREAAERRQADYERRARAHAIEQARDIWASAEGFDVAPAAAYLAGRGITFESWPPTLRYLPAHPYKRKIAGQFREWHRGPAMIAAIQGPDHKVQAVHQTWFDPDRPGQKAEILGPDGDKQPAKLTRGSVKGGAIRLTPMPLEGECLIVGEGIETTASPMMIDAVPGAAYWAGVSLTNMAGVQLKEGRARNSGRPDLSDQDAFMPPPWIGRLIFLQDGDSEPKATRAKLLSGLRRARAHNPALTIEIVAAPAGKDFNDVLRGDPDAEI